MLLHVIFGQRVESYEGEFAPEALEVMDEYGYDENSEWLHKKLQYYRTDQSFANVEIMEIELGKDAIDLLRKRLLGHLQVGGVLVAQGK